MKPLAPPNARGRVSAVGRRLLPPAPTQPAVPRELATLTWSAAAVGVPAVDDPTWVPRAEFPSPTLRRFAPPKPPSPADVAAAPPSAAAPPVPIARRWAPPVEPPPPASARSGWTWTPIMATGATSSSPVESRPHDDVIDLSIRLDTFEALIAEHSAETRLHADAPCTVAESAIEPTVESSADPTGDEWPGSKLLPPPPEPAAAPDAPVGTSIRVPSVSFEPASGTVSAERVGGDIAIVTAEVPVFTSYAPAGDLVLPDAPVMAPPEVEVREAVMALPPPRPRPIRGVRTSLLGLVVAGVAVAGAYLGLREYIYGGEVAQDGPRMVEVEPARPVVIPAP